MQSFWDCSYSATIGAVARLLSLTLWMVLWLTATSGRVLCQPTSVVQGLPSKSELSSNLDTYIYFAGPEDMEKPEISASAATLVPWAEADKQAVRLAIRDAFAKTPWLIAGSGWKHKVAFGRISQTSSSHTFRGSTPYAISGPGYVIFTDTFFAAKNQAHALVHELVHVADCGNRLAYSQEWVKFAQPTICKLRLREQLLTQKGWFWYDADIQKRNIWPGLYAAENLKEALAEYFTAYEEASKFPIAPEFKDTVAPHLIAPTEDELAWRDVMTQAIMRFKCQQFEAAIPLFLEAQKIDPGPPTLDYYLAECLMHRVNGAELAMPSISQAVDKLSELGVAVDEPMLHVALLLKSNVLRKNGKFAEAVALTNRVLSQNLYDEDARFIRGASENLAGPRGQALQDIYYSRGCFGFVFVSLMGIGADPEVARLAVDEIVKKEKSADALWGRAQFFEQCAHTSEQVPQRDAFDKLALADYQASMAKGDSHKVDGLLRCADLYLKLGDAAAAQESCTQAAQIHTESLAPQIMQLKIWEATGDKRWHKELLKINRLMPEEQQMAELHDYNYLEPPSPALDSAEWQKAF